MSLGLAGLIAIPWMRPVNAPTLVGTIAGAVFYTVGYWITPFAVGAVLTAFVAIFSKGKTGWTYLMVSGGVLAIMAFSQILGSLTGK
jgi:hypothetical protein